MTSDVVNQLLIIIHQTLRIICMIRKAQWDSPSTQILSSNRRCKRNHATIATRALWVKARDEWKHFSPAWETLEPFFLCDSELNHKTSSWSVWITKVIKYCIWPEWFRALELLYFLLPQPFVRDFFDGDCFITNWQMSYIDIFSSEEFP